MDQAIRDGDVDQVRECISQRNDLSSLNKVNNKSGLAPIHLACLNGNAAIIELLFDAGRVNLINEDRKGRLPIHCAVEGGFPEAVATTIRWLNKKPGWLAKCLTMRDFRGWTPFHLALVGTNVESGIKVLDLLLDNLPETFSCRDTFFAMQQKGNTEPATGLLHKAVLTGSLEIVKTIVNSWESFGLAKKTDLLEDRDFHGCTPLLVACAEGHQAIAAFLVENGIDITCVDKSGQNAAHWAYSMGHVTFGDWIISKAAHLEEDLEIEDMEGNTPGYWRKVHVDAEQKFAQIELEEKTKLEQKKQSINVQVQQSQDPPRPPSSPVNSPIQSESKLGSPETGHTVITKEIDIDSIRRGLVPSPISARKQNAKWSDDRESLLAMLEQDTMNIQEASISALQFADDKTATSINQTLDRFEANGYWNHIQNA